MKNDYQLSKVNLNDKTHYFAEFINCKGEKIVVEINKEVHDIIKDYQTKENSFERECRRMCLCTLDESIIGVIDTDETLFLKKYELATKTLTPTEKRRFNMHFFGNLKIIEIAKSEAVYVNAVEKSLKKAYEKIKKTKIFKKN
jgi:uncharacterized membrane protein YiaA